MKVVPLSFFKHDAVLVAQKLLGSVIRYKSCSGMIVETEAYRADPASHAYRITPRSAIMRDTSGHWYVYFVYGMHYCMNITTNGIGEPGAVLIRALEPLEGVELMKKRRGTDDARSLCSGPGKLCEALGVDRRLNGTAVGERMHVERFRRMGARSIAATPRIGINEGKEHLWRFFVKGSAFVSKTKQEERSYKK